MKESRNAGGNKEQPVGRGSGYGTSPGTGTIVPGTTSQSQHDGAPGERIEHARAFGIHSWPGAAVKVGPQ